MAKQPVKPAAKKPAAKPAVKAQAAAKPGKAEAGKTEAAKPAGEPAMAAKPKPQVPPRPVPAHQQFLGGGGKGGVKPQHMTKARIIRHQGR